MRRFTIVVVALLTTLLVATPALAIDEVNTKRLRNAVTVGGILSHERVFQRIANQNGGTRASGTEGYNASADYVAGAPGGRRLRGHHAGVQFPFFQELTPAELEQVSPTPTAYETGTFDYSGSGEVKARCSPTNDKVIPPTPVLELDRRGASRRTSTPAPAGPAIALIQRGGCDFSVKAANAQAAGYDAVDHLQRGQPGPRPTCSSAPSAARSHPGGRPQLRRRLRPYRPARGGPDGGRAGLHRDRERRCGRPATSSPTRRPAAPTAWWSWAPTSTR